MSGTQRFSGDADAICSVWHSGDMIEDHNPDKIKERNYDWTTRGRPVFGRGIRVKPTAANPDLMDIEYCPQFGAHDGGEDDDGPAF
jgi:hypothetical protein